MDAGKERYRLIRQLARKKFLGISVHLPPEHDHNFNEALALENSLAASQYPAELRNFLLELLALSFEELKARVAIENEQEAKRSREIENAREQAQFYNQDYAAASFDRWFSVDLWTAEEAVALSLGKDPQVVQRERVARIERSRFVRVYMWRTELIERAIEAGVLRLRDKPYRILCWLEQKKLPVPEELKYELQRMRSDISANTGVLEADDRLSAAQTRIEILESELRERTRCIEELEADIRRLRLSEHPRPTDEKMILAMAMQKYRFKPKNQKNDAPQNIANDCAELGLTVNPRSIRDRLYGAAKKHEAGHWD